MEEVVTGVVSFLLDKFTGASIMTAGDGQCVMEWKSLRVLIGENDDAETFRERVRTLVPERALNAAILLVTPPRHNVSFVDDKIPVVCLGGGEDTEVTYGVLRVSLVLLDQLVTAGVFLRKRPNHEDRADLMTCIEESIIFFHRSHVLLNRDRRIIQDLQAQLKEREKACNDVRAAFDNVISPIHNVIVETPTTTEEIDQLFVQKLVQYKRDNPEKTITGNICKEIAGMTDHNIRTCGGIKVIASMVIDKLKEN
jgi:hypothetical protein